MQPRLPNSRKWSPLPKELMQQVRAVFEETFEQHLSKGSLVAEGRIYPEEILVMVGYRAKDALKQSSFEVSIAYKKDKDNVLKLIHIAVDAAGSLLDQLFNSETDEEFPTIWTEVDFEGRQIFVQYTTVNSELEAEADKLLGLKEGDVDLAGGEWDDEITPDQVKAALGIDPGEIDPAILDELIEEVLGESASNEPKDDPDAEKEAKAAQKAAAKAPKKPVSH